jgi:hypothetical protein
MGTLWIVGMQPPDKEWITHVETNLRASAERIRLDPDGRFAAFRAARARYEATGDYSHIQKFVSELKAGFDQRLARDLT